MARVVVLEQRTGHVIRQLPLPDGPYEIAYGNGSLFAASYRTGRLLRIDANYRIHPLQPLGGPGMLIAITRGVIWATNKSGLVRRIPIPTRWRWRRDAERPVSHTPEPERDRPSVARSGLSRQLLLQAWF